MPLFRHNEEFDAMCRIEDQLTAKHEVKASQVRLPPPLRAFKQDILVTAAEESMMAVTEDTVIQQLPGVHILPYNDPTTMFKIDTPLFSGKAVLLLRNLPNTPKGVFDGKLRQIQLTVQGRFKRPDVSLDSMVCGAFQDQPLQLHASLSILLDRAAAWIEHAIGGGTQAKTSGSRPCLSATLIAGAQVVNVSLPGDEPGLMTVTEDMTLFDPALVSRWTGKPLSGKQRRSHFASSANRQGRCFSTDHVWTFQMYDHTLNYATFHLNVPFFKLDMVQVLGGRPMRLMIKDDQSGLSMLSMCVWHRRMLQHPANASTAAATAAEDSST